MCRFLIVEDSTETMEVLETILTDSGYKVMTAVNAMDGYKLIKGIREIRGVFTDLHLPGMDGLTLARQIKKIDPLMYICAITGYSDVFTLIEARECGVDDFVVKPFGLEVIRDIADSAYRKIVRWDSYKY